MTLATVQDYVSDARVLLQDTVAPYRYPDADLVEALNMAMLEASRLRPDIILDARYQSRMLRVQASSNLSLSAPAYTANDTTPVVWPLAYKMPVLYFIVGQAQLRDTEDTQDARATAFMARYVAQLLTIGA